MARLASLQVYVAEEPDENDPSTDNGPSVTLHLYRPSGEFCVECSVSTCMTVIAFTQLLEEGKVTPELDLRSTKTRAPWRNSEAGIERLHVDYIYKLVWNDMVLTDWWTFSDYVLCDGLSQNEPNDIYVIKQECVTTVMSPAA
jgi:hypothetical protein